FVLECVRQKLPHYILPIVPPLAFLVADLLVQTSRRRVADLRSRAIVGGAAVWGLGVAAAGSALWIAAIPALRLTPLPTGLMALASVITLVYGVTVFELIRRRRPIAAARVMTGGMLAGVLFAFGLLIPRLAFLAPAKRAAESVVASAQG